MKFIRKKISFISLFMTTMMLLIVVPFQPLLAAMIPTEATIDQIKAQDARDHLKALFSFATFNQLGDIAQTVW